MKKIYFAILALLTLCSTAARAEEVTEDFESVTLSDVDSWGYGKGLSNDWQVVGGSIYTSAGSTNYGLWSTAYNGSKKSLEASYSSTNSAIMVIPVQLSGNFTFYARKTSSSSSTKGYVDLYEMEPDGDSFKKVGSTSFKYWTLTSTTWTQYTVDLGDEPRYIGICLSRAAIDDVTYNTYEAAAGPRLQVLQDSKAVKNGVDYSFGLVAENANVTYTLKNAGTETLNATLACTGDYSVSPANVSLGADETADITITQSASTTGSKAGTLTITPEGLDAFTVNLAGIVRDPAKLFVDFSEAPANWTIDSNWTIADGYAKIGYYSSYSGGTGRIETPLIQVAVGECLYLRYSKNTTSSYSSAYFSILTSIDGETWTKLGDNRGTDAVYGEWKETTITNIPTNVKYIAISGQYIAIDDFYGFELSADPAMAITDETIVDNTITQSFGKCKADAVKTYTVKNSGAGALHVDLTNSNTTDFTISETSLDVAVGESATFDLTFNFSDEYGTKNTTITLTPNAGDVITINASAAAQDPEEFEENFENGIPESWTNNGFEIASNPSYGNGTKMAYAGKYSYDNTLTTPLLLAKAGDEIQIEALLPWDDETLTMEYSYDMGETWNVAFAETPAANNTLCTLSWTAPEDGYIYLRFSGRYNYIDNICGFKLAEITLNEKAENFDVVEKEYGKITMNRTLKANVWNTFCVPFDMTADEIAANLGDGAEVKELTGITASENSVEMTFGDATSILAGKAYMVKVNDVVSKITVMKKTVTTADNASEATDGDYTLTFHGNYTSMNAPMNSYIISSNVFYEVDSDDVLLKAFRGYLTLEKNNSGNAVKGMLLYFGFDDVPTAIHATEQNNSLQIYDLSGRRVQNMGHGLYIVNGKKVIK